MTLAASPIVHNRHDIYFLFDVENGNPNGDPDMSNAPRIELETGHGVVTDVCLKRKVRNVINQLLRPDTPGFDLYVCPDMALNEAREAATTKIDPSDERLKTSAGRSKIVCETYVDVRMFGAALAISKSEKGKASENKEEGEDDNGLGAEEGKSNGKKMGKNKGKSEENSSSYLNVRGPLQVGMARSIDPIHVQNYTITRMAREKREDDKENKQMGSKAVIPYALFGVKIFVNSFLAKKTGMTEDDLEVFKQALHTMFMHDMSATRGFMSPRLCVAFKHESIYGNAQAYDLFDRVHVRKTVDGFPTRYKDYEITIDDQNLPPGVTMERWI